MMKRSVYLFFLAVFLSTFLGSGCSQVREVPQPVGEVPDLSGMYPHDSAWRAQHMAYYAMVTAPSALHQQACLGCHESKAKGRPLNISCGANCHEKRPPARFRDDFVTSTALVPSSCTECHAEKTDDRFSHHPVALGLCSVCHEATPEHQAGSGGGVKTDFTADACYRCHDRQDQHRNVHQAIGEGLSCSNCHDPHGESRAFFVKKETADLCLKCHQKDVSGSHSVHVAAFQGDSCLGCHVPHSGRRPKLLSADPDAQCISCHFGFSRVFERPSVHAALSYGCTSCHSPHASDYRELLKNAYPRAGYLRYSGAEGFALCFECHDPGMLEPYGDTQFRDGKKNLHWIHVTNVGRTTGPDFGRSCAICHEPHAADQARLIKGELGANRVPMTYGAFSGGGQCGPSCHMPRVYFR